MLVLQPDDAPHVRETDPGTGRDRTDLQAPRGATPGIGIVIRISGEFMAAQSSIVVNRRA